MDREQNRVLDLYVPSGRVYCVRPDLVMNYYPNDIRYARIRKAMLREVVEIEIERGRG